MAAAQDPLADAGCPQRLDKWLYFARLAKSRTLATDLILGGKVRVNRSRAGKPSHPLRPGEVVTIALHGRVLVLKVLAPGRRRGPVTEARALYEVLAPRPGSSLGDTPARARAEPHEED